MQGEYERKFEPTTEQQAARPVEPRTEADPAEDALTDVLHSDHPDQQSFEEDVCLRHDRTDAANLIADLAAYGWVLAEAVCPVEGGPEGAKRALQEAMQLVAERRVRGSVYVPVEDAESVRFQLRQRGYDILAKTPKDAAPRSGEELDVDSLTRLIADQIPNIDVDLSWRDCEIIAGALAARLRENDDA